MDAKPTELTSLSPPKASNSRASATTVSQTDTTKETPALLSTSGISSWARSFKLLQSSSQDNSGATTFSRLTSGLLRLPSAAPPTNESAQDNPTTVQSGVLGTLTKGIVDSSRSAVKAVQVKARHIVSQNKRRYQEGGFDLDLTYITENIIAMGFPAGDMSSGLFGYIEGFYRNHMVEVIKFFEMHHQGKYKVYNLCSERLYDAALFKGKVAHFPADDHNCPPVDLILSFCQSASLWLKEDIENVVVVHCKAGMGRTGLMICSLLLFLKFFPTAQEAIDYYNQKRCIDGKALVLPSQIRYVKYFGHILVNFQGETPAGRRCMLRGFRLHGCPYWIRPSITISSHNGVLFSTKKHPKTKDLTPEDFWIRAPKKGLVVFAIPGEPGLTELAGDFKIHFHERDGDFYCWLNTTMMENRTTLRSSDLDGFDKRKLPCPGFQVEIVMVDFDDSLLTNTKPDSSTKSNPSSTSNHSSASGGGVGTHSNRNEMTRNEEDDVFSDSDGEETVSQKNKLTHADHGDGPTATVNRKIISTVTECTAKMSPANEESNLKNSFHEVKVDAGAGKTAGKANPGGVSDFKVVAADASVFTFGDEEDYESD